MRRRIVHPYGHTIPVSRAFSLLFALAILGMLYERMRDPATWRWLIGEGPQVQVAAAPLSPPPGPQPDERIVPVPNDTDPAAVEELQHLLVPVHDKIEMQPRDMPAYWRLMEWSRSEPLASLQQRAIKDVPFDKVFNQPDRYRGKPVHMRAHVRRCIEEDALPNNPLGLTKVYEAWVFTEDSQSFPYVLVFPELPAGLPLGTEIRGDVEFTGYLLKVMLYKDKLGKPRGGPVFIGRARATVIAAPKAPPSLDYVLFLAMVGGVMLAGLFWVTLSRKPLKLDRGGLGAATDAGPFWETQPIGEVAADSAATNPFENLGSHPEK